LMPGGDGYLGLSPQAGIVRAFSPWGESWNAIKDQQFENYRNRWKVADGQEQVSGVS
jgi:hypothetical protein